MRKSPTFDVPLICKMCGESTPRTGATQKYCPACRQTAIQNYKKKHYIKTNPNAYAPSNTPQKCSVCDLPFSSYFDNVPYCNKHYLRMYTNGITELVGRKTNNFVIENDIVTMITNKGVPFTFDTKYLDKVKKYSWCVSRTGYLVANINHKVTKLHRYILDLSNPKIVVDHIDGDPMNNTSSNLRLCNNKQNTRNTSIAINNNSGYIGVRKVPSGKYQARIMVNRKEINLGRYDTFDEAKQVRIQAEHEYFGEFSPSKGASK